MLHAIYNHDLASLECISTASKFQSRHTHHGRCGSPLFVHRFPSFRCENELQWQQQQQQQYRREGGVALWLSRAAVYLNCEVQGPKGTS